MQIDRGDAASAVRPPEPNFTGEVRIGGYFERAASSRLAGTTVTFAPGARTPWKVNPLGQTLVVTSGFDWAQVEGEPIVELRAGDVVWCSPGRRHWDDATPDRAMTYVAIQEVGQGGSVRFGEKVTDEEYRQGCAGLSPGGCWPGGDMRLMRRCELNRERFGTGESG